MVPSLDDLKKLTVPERLQIVEALWDSIAEESSALPVTAEQAAILDERLAEMESDPDSGRPWEEFRRTLDKRS